MDISKVQAVLSEEDLLSIINEFVDLKGLNIEYIKINNEIEIKGSYKLGIKFNFEGALIIEKVQDNKIYCKFSKMKLFKLGFFRPFRSLVLKKSFENINIDGFSSEKDVLIIDIKKVLYKIPFVDIDISNVYVKENKVYVDVENVKVSIKGTLIKEEIKEEVEEEEKEDLTNIEKVEDGYTNGREILDEKLPEQIKDYSKYLWILPDLVNLVYRLLKDKRVPLKTKIAVSASVAYLVIPNDFVPDSIPFVGKIDDLAVVIFALNRIAKDVSTKIILENWAGDNDLLLSLKEGLAYAMEFTGAKNVDKIYGMIQELSTL